MATSDEHGKALSRREALMALSVLTLGAAFSPERTWADVPRHDSTDPRRSLLETLCELVIPATDTPGAREAGVPDFVELAIKHGLHRSAPDLLSSVAAALDELANGSFLALSHEQRVALLADVDRRASTPLVDSGAPPILTHWITLKALIVIGYYTSEVGGAVELRYDLVPGRFEPDIPSMPGDRAWSSDWTGVKYG